MEGEGTDLALKLGFTADTRRRHFESLGKLCGETRPRRAEEGARSGGQGDGESQVRRVVGEEGEAGEVDRQEGDERADRRGPRDQSTGALNRRRKVPSHAAP